MCLYPIRIKNKKYVENDKNQGVIPELPVIGHDEIGLPIYDQRVTYVDVPCGRCKECCEKKAREWSVRLYEEIKDWEYKYFVTFTFSPKGLREICQKHGIHETTVNAAAKYALRHCLERYRKDFGHSLRHWFVTELGHQGTERIHMHGILFSNEPLQFTQVEEVQGKGNFVEWKYWKYGYIFVGNFVNGQSVNYITKYMNKIDEDHKDYKCLILASPGIGSRYVQHLIEKGDYSYTYRPRATKDYYRLPNGTKVALPKYYMNKWLNDEERELRWREIMDRNQTIIAGNVYSTRSGWSGELQNNITLKAQEMNKQFGFGDRSREWRLREYNVTDRMLKEGYKLENE